MHNFFRERLKKVVQKFRQKFGRPGSEVLDPLVSTHVYIKRRAVTNWSYTGKGENAKQRGNTGKRKGEKKSKAAMRRGENITERRVHDTKKI